MEAPPDDTPAQHTPAQHTPAQHTPAQHTIGSDVSAPPPLGAPVVPPGYESGLPRLQAQGQPDYRSSGAPSGPVFVPHPRPRRTRVRLRDGMEVPEHGRVIERRYPFLMWPGLGVFAVSYALSTLLVTSSDATAAIPFVGPLIWQARSGVSADLELTVPLTLLQVVGAVVFAIGVKKRRFLETWRIGDQIVPGPVARTPRHLALVPQIHRGGGGISLVVR